MTDRTMPSIPSFIERLGEVLGVDTQKFAAGVRDAGSGMMAAGAVKGMTNVQNLGPDFMRNDFAISMNNGLQGQGAGQALGQGQGQAPKR